MSKKRLDKLKVISSGITNHIDVPSIRALALHNYLRSFGVPTSPPQPRSTDMDSIELGKGTDATAIQALLDKWM
jgi:hypothetical protein